MEQVFRLLERIVWHVVHTWTHRATAERCGAVCVDADGVVRRCSNRREHAGEHFYRVEAVAPAMLTWPNIKIGERGRAIARVTFLLPALADDALHAVLLVCEAAPKRALDAGTLAEEQRTREANPLALDVEDGTLCAGCDAPRNTIHGALCPMRWGHAVGRKTAPAELTDAQVLEACAQSGAITEEQRARLEADGRPLAVSRAMANALGSVINHHEDAQALPMPDVMLNLNPVEGGESTKRATAVHEAAERLGFVYLVPGSDAYKAREDLFASLGAYFGTDTKDVDALIARAEKGEPLRAPALMPGEQKSATEHEARRRMTGPGRADLDRVQQRVALSKAAGLCGDVKAGSAFTCTLIGGHEGEHVAEGTGVMGQQEERWIGGAA